MGGVQYLVDDHGKRTAIVIPLQGNESALEEFLEDLYGRKVIEERRNEETISKEALLKGLQDEGLL
jgi:hypothetical protein